MPLKIDKMRIKVDKRRKLDANDKLLIIKMHDEGWSIRKLADKFEVNKRLIQFILYPERLEHLKELRRQRLLFDPQRYYDKETHRKAMVDLRARKKVEHPELYDKICPICKKRFWASRTDRKYCSKKCLWTEQNHRKKTLHCK